MLYIREDIPSKSLAQIKSESHTENISTEINLRSKKWLISGSYKPKLSHIKNHLQEPGELVKPYKVHLHATKMQISLRLMIK